MGLIFLIISAVATLVRGDFYYGYLPWLLWFGGGSYTIKGRITINSADGTAANNPHESDDYDPMKCELRIAPHTKAKPQRKHHQKPEWWRFLTEESIGSLLEKRRQKKRQQEIDNLAKKYERNKI